MDYYANACKDIPSDILTEIEYRRDHTPYTIARTSLIWAVFASYLRPRPRSTSARQIEEMGRLYTTTINAAMGVDQ